MATTAQSSQQKTNYANVAANLANTNRKVVEPRPPKHAKYVPHLHGPARSKSLSNSQSRSQPSTVSLASSKAALLAHQGQAGAPTRSSPSKNTSTLESRAAAAAVGSSNLPHTARPRRPASSDGPSTVQSSHGVGDRAAAAATKSWNTTHTTPARANTVYGSRDERASPAVAKAWSAQKPAAHRPVVAPLSEREAAMIQRRIEARQQESSERRERQPIIKIKPEYLGEHPPVRLEREEKAHAADLHAQAVSLAKQAYARQQQQQNQTATGNAPKTAQQLANEKLARMRGPEVDDLDAMRNYYGTPAPVQRSKSQRLLKRSKSQQSRAGGSNDAAQTQRIRSQMNQLRSQIDEVDAGKQEQDRKRLLEAARKKVQNDMLKMDEGVYKDTGKMSKAMMDDWDSKARERTRNSRQQAAFQGLHPDRAVNIGGDRLIDQSEIDQLAASRVKPTLAGIDEAVQKKRDLDDQKREEKEERQREKEKEREEKAELKRERAEEKRKLKEQKDAEKAEAAATGEEKHSTIAEKLPSLPQFRRHKRDDSDQAEQHAGQTEATTDDDVVSGNSPNAEKRRSLRLPAFTKFSRHRRNESVETASQDDVSSLEESTSEKRTPRKLPLFSKLGRTRDQPAADEPEEQAVGRSTSPTPPASKSFKSRFSRLVHRSNQSGDAPDTQKTQARSFEHANGSVSTDLHDDGRDSISSISDNDDEILRPTISAPIPVEGASPLERVTSVDERDDKLFGKHLPSKFHENM